MDNVSNFGPVLGMSVLWWCFWILMMMSIFAFNIPEHTGVNLSTPRNKLLFHLKRRLARGLISEAEYIRISSLLNEKPNFIIPVDSNLDAGINENNTERAEGMVTQSRKNEPSFRLFADHPVTDGLSLSATWSILYSIYSLFYWLAPQTMMSATRKLVNGMSFSWTESISYTFSFADYVSVLTIGAVYLFFIGVIWSLIHSYYLQQLSEFKINRTKSKHLLKTQLKTQER